MVLLIPLTFLIILVLEAPPLVLIAPKTISPFIDTIPYVFFQPSAKSSMQVLSALNDQLDNMINKLE